MKRWCSVVVEHEDVQQEYCLLSDDRNEDASDKSLFGEIMGRDHFGLV